MYTVNLNTIGVFVAVGALIGLLIGLGAGLALWGGEPKPPRRGLALALRLWRHKTDGTLWVQMEDEAAVSPQALPAEQQAALRRLLQELRTRFEQPPALAASESEPPPPPPPPPIPAPGSESLSRNPLRPFREAFAARKKPPLEPAASASIAAQVDDILQEMLRGTSLESRGIRLMELPGQGMVVMIGLEKFATVDEVPYEEVRLLLRKAVAAWEEKMLGGE